VPSPRASSDLINQLIPGDSNRSLSLEVVESAIELLPMALIEGQNLGIATKAPPELVEQLELLVAAEGLDVYRSLSHEVRFLTAAIPSPLK